MPKRPVKRISRKVRESCEHRSSERTARFIVRRLTEIQDDLADLFADFRTFEHYSELEDAAWVVWKLHEIRRRYEKFVELGYWDERG